MTTEQKRKMLQRIVDIEHDIEELKRVRIEILTNGYASATLASSGGSKSYTKIDSAKISEAISQLQQELKSVRSILRGQGSVQIMTIETIYS